MGTGVDLCAHDWLGAPRSSPCGAIVLWGGLPPLTMNSPRGSPTTGLARDEVACGLFAARHCCYFRQDKVSMDLSGDPRRAPFEAVYRGRVLLRVPAGCGPWQGWQRSDRVRCASLLVRSTAKKPGFSLWPGPASGLRSMERPVDGTHV